MSNQESLRTAEPDFFRLPNGDKIGELYIDTPKDQIHNLKRCVHTFMDMEAHGDISIVYDNFERFYSAEHTSALLERGDVHEIDRYIQNIIKLSFYSVGVRFINPEPTERIIKGLQLDERQSARQIFDSTKNSQRREVIIFNPNAHNEQFLTTPSHPIDLIGRQKRVKIIDPGYVIIIEK